MCVACGRKMQIDVVLTDARGSRSYCPNHLVEALLSGKLRFKPNMKVKDELRGEYGAVKFVSPFSREQYILSPATMRRLINHSLYKAEYKGLIRNLKNRGQFNGYGNLPYMIHDDFYTEDGESWQYCMPNPQLTKMYQ